jgi:hypothetical protein
MVKKKDQQQERQRPKRKLADTRELQKRTQVIPPRVRQELPKREQVIPPQVPTDLGETKE